jgi:hypothetical protein
MSHNPMGLHGLLQEQLYRFVTLITLLTSQCIEDEVTGAVMELRHNTFLERKTIKSVISTLQEVVTYVPNCTVLHVKRTVIFSREEG